jgi:type III secretory pathway component EscU
MVSLCTQLHLVLLKNLRYKLRNARDTFAEILMPCVFALLLSIIFTNTTSTYAHLGFMSSLEDSDFMYISQINDTGCYES